jgi:exodeoxyribonuclease VII large subunit
LSTRLAAALQRRFDRAQDGLIALEKLRQSLDPNRPLQRGFARVHHIDGRLARRAADLTAGEAIQLVFVDQAVGAVVDGAGPSPSGTTKRGRVAPHASKRGAQMKGDPSQGDLSHGDSSQGDSWRGKAHQGDLF